VNDRRAGVAGLQSPILKFLPAPVIEEVLERVHAESGDVVFFGADAASVVNDAMGALRNQVAADLGLIRDGWAPLWVVDWPLFEKGREGRVEAVHHPFTGRLRRGHAAARPLSAGTPTCLSSCEAGPIRIHRTEMQQAVFEALGIGQKARLFCWTPCVTAVHRTATRSASTGSRC
jgi:aspartyl-tRNA synthetase